MADDYYGDPTEDSQPMGGNTSMEEDDTQGQDDQDQNEQGETFLAPKSAFPEQVNPGDTWTFKAVQSYDDDIEWEPVAPAESPKKTSAAPQSANDELDQMAMS